MESTTAVIVVALAILVGALILLGTLEHVGVELPGPLAPLGRWAWTLAAALIGAVVAVMGSRLLKRNKDDERSDSSPANASPPYLYDTPQPPLATTIMDDDDRARPDRIKQAIDEELNAGRNGRDIADRRDDYIRYAERESAERARRDQE